MDISPDKQNIDRVFSNTTYYIDFYQRDYKWTSEPVERLLDDIFFKFNEEYEKFKSLDPSKETITNKYPWYYLNTYVTNTIEGKVYVVDGQQRLTTLTLILIALNKTAVSYKSKLQKWIENKIAGQSGYDFEFWMNHEKHVETLRDLFEGEKELKEIDTSSGITAVNLVRNYSTIESWLKSQLSDQHNFETFVFYFLHRLVLINLAVEQTDVPMVFEVINDRGVRLKPYEILKGKLLGQIDKLELDKKDYNGLWETQVKAINNYKEDEIDSFFRYYLKGKYVNTRKEGTRFDGEYQREIFSNDMDKVLKLKHNSLHVKDFLENAFSYYTHLYLKLLDAYYSNSEKYPYVYLNRLNEMDSQFMLILSGIKLDDPEEDTKINTLAYELDRLFSLLQLQNAYDSNAFNDTVYLISSEIRDKPLDNVRPVFNKYLLKVLAERRNTQVTSTFQYSFFKNIGISLNTRFKRYFFARVEKFLSDNMNLNIKHSLSDLVSKTGHKTGFHIEHILSYNEENLKLFNNDDDLFEQERNRLGGILLLKGKDNISSNNEPYTEKLKSYANTLYWNETLRNDSYKSKLDMRSLKERFQLDLKPLDQFGQEELDQRHKILFEIAKIIWG
jgi:uncharacterized protein with ParB-like and HNH nuclease domain